MIVQVKNAEKSYKIIKNYDLKIYNINSELTNNSHNLILEQGRIAQSSGMYSYYAQVLWITESLCALILCLMEKLSFFDGTS